MMEPQAALQLQQLFTLVLCSLKIFTLEIWSCNMHLIENPKVTDFASTSRPKKTPAMTDQWLTITGSSI